MSLSELMIIIIAYHHSADKNFNSHYHYIQNYHLQQFPKLISSHRFIEWIPLSAYLKFRRGQITGISYIDSCPIAVCKNIRIPRNKVFKGLARRGKSSLGWFFGFKLHLIVNQVGELLAVKVTTGNVNDRTPVRNLCQGLRGKLFADQGYLGKQLFEQLFEDGLELITNLRSNLKNKLIPLGDKLLLGKRFIIETINDQLKNISHIDYTPDSGVQSILGST